MPQHRDQFAVGDAVVYPPHGLGRVVDLASQDIAGQMLDIIVMRFEPAAMTVRLPSRNRQTVGLRQVATKRQMAEALDALPPAADGAPGAADPGDWKRRVKQYVDQVNSGDPVRLARVVSDLAQRAGTGPLPAAALAVYRTAMSRLAQELAIVEQITEPEAEAQIAELALGKPASISEDGAIVA
jgi:CarD family transcriptional regulator